MVQAIKSRRNPLFFAIWIFKLLSYIEMRTRVSIWAQPEWSHVEQMHIPRAFPLVCDFRAKPIVPRLEMSPLILHSRALKVLPLKFATVAVAVDIFTLNCSAKMERLRAQKLMKSELAPTVN